MSIDYAAPYGVFSVARRFDPDLDAFLVADAMRPVQTQAGLTVLPNYHPSFDLHHRDIEYADAGQARGAENRKEFRSASTHS